VLITRAVQATVRMDTGQLSPEARTRLRLIRRLLFLVIILIGVALALSQFTSIKRFATGVLASTAVLGIIIGFAGRPVIADLVSGLLLAITPPCPRPWPRACCWRPPSRSGSATWYRSGTRSTAG